MKIMLLLFSLFLLTKPTYSACFASKTTYILKSKSLSQTEMICSLEVQDKIFYVAKKCFDQKNTHPCSLGFQEPSTDLAIKGLWGEIGSPGFKICYELKGEPQIFTFQSPTSKSIEESDRCLFKNGEWLEIPLLVEKFKDRLKNID